MWPGTLHHHLHARIPRTARELAYLDEFGYLGRVGGVVGGTGAHGVAQADGHVVLVQDGQHLVVELVEGVLVAGGLHPREDERAAAAHDVREPARFAEGLDDAAVHAGVDGDEVHAVLGVRAHDVEEVLGGDGRRAASPSTRWRRTWARCRSWPATSPTSARRNAAVLPLFDRSMMASAPSSSATSTFFHSSASQARSPEIPKFTFTFVRRPAPTPSGERLAWRMFAGMAMRPAATPSRTNSEVAPLLLGHGLHLARDGAGAGGVDLRDGPGGGGRCGRRGGPRRFVMRHRTPFVGITHASGSSGRSVPALPLSLPGRQAAASLPGMKRCEASMRQPVTARIPRFAQCTKTPARRLKQGAQVGVVNQRGRPWYPEIARRRDAPAGRSVGVVLCPSVQRIEHVQRALFHGDGGLFARAPRSKGRARCGS